MAYHVQIAADGTDFIPFVEHFGQQDGQQNGNDSQAEVRFERANGLGHPVTGRQSFFEMADAALNPGTVVVEFKKFIRITKDTGEQAQLLEIVGVEHAPRWFYGAGISTQADSLFALPYDLRANPFLSDET